MGFEPPRLFVDTWGWLVLADAGHPAHAQAVHIRRRYTARGKALVTTDYVLDELITRLFTTTYFEEARAFCETTFQAGPSRPSEASVNPTGLRRTGRNACPTIHT